VEHLEPARSLLSFFAGVAITLPVAAAGAWYIGIPAADRRALASSLRRFRRSTFGRA
jgi:hypothetical protein